MAGIRKLVGTLGIAAGIVLLFASVAGPAFGQAQTGNIFVKVVDETAAPLPGVAVTLSGVGAPVTSVTNAAGETRFLNLSPANTYTLATALSGFASVTRANLVVTVNNSTAVTLSMKLSGVQESIVVTGESPLLDVRRTGSQSTVSQVELNSVPSARDPWVVLQTAPGVQIDRVNVGGSESGQQSNYVGKGSSNQGTWNVDGVNITDMAATGSSPMYYDFDSVAEMSLSMGGADAAVQTPGVQLNVVTKRGTNDVHGSARVFYETKRWSSSNTPDELLTQATAPGGGNQIDQLQDYGLEMGGPIVKDLLWLWGSYGRNQIDLVTAGGLADKTTLNDFGFKLNAQPIPENSFNAVYSYADKVKTGRNAAWNRPAETAWNQSGPTKIYKVEDSHVFSANVFATASYSRVMGGFDLLTPGQSQMYIDGTGIYHNTYIQQMVKRPQTQLNVNPSFFFRTGNIGHEIKAGFTYRDTPWGTQQWYPTGLIGVSREWWGTDYDVAGFTRPFNGARELTSYAGYLSDTLTIDKLTVQAGVRYDYQWGRQPEISVTCCDYGTAAWPEVLLGSMDLPATEPLIWKDFSPRLGATYALGNDGKTLLKASYARFVAQMGGNVVNVGFAAAGGASGIGYLYYEWNDANGNQKVEQGEVNFDNLDSWRAFDPNNPNSVTTSNNQLDYDMTTPKTDEFVLSGEREVLPAFVVGVAGTYRHMSDFIYAPRLAMGGARVLTAADYTCTEQGPYPVPNGSPQMITVCNPTSPGVYGTGSRSMNRPGYYQTYWGIDFSATKRYSDKWMARFNFTYSDWTQHGLAEGQWDPSNRWGGTEAEGGALAPSFATSGPKADVYINSKWQTTLAAMYTLPLDFNLSTSLFARQGYPTAYYVNRPSTNTPGSSSKNYQLGNVDDVRLDTVIEWDMGLAKVVKVGPTSISLQLDVFNLLNQNTVLQRTSRVRSTITTPNATDSIIGEVQSPRVFRVGARISF